MAQSTDRKTSRPDIGIHDDERARRERQTERGTQTKRSCSWSHRQSIPSPLSNQFCLSRQVRGLQDKNQDRKSVTFDEPLINSHLVKDNPDLVGPVSQPAAPHILKLTEPAGHRRYLPQEAIRDQPTDEISGTRSHDRGAEDISPSFHNNSKQSEQSNHSKGVGESTLSQLRQLRTKGPGRRKIMRTVSQDDYLLARGANPRTGVITPSVHSGSSSMDDAEWSKIREASQLSKWRLRGDQWVSHSLNEAIPLPSPPPGRTGWHTSRPLRLPPKLARGRLLGELTEVPDRGQQSMIGTGQQVLISSQSQPTLEQGKSQFSRARLGPEQCEQVVNGTVIKRKPLGNPPTQRSVDNLSSAMERRDVSTETVITKPGHTQKNRSSSMPTPQEFRFFRPEDVGKELPPLPASKSNGDRDIHGENGSHKKPFLGLRPGDWIEDVPNWVSGKASGSEHHLPCLPMKDIPFRSRQLQKPAIQHQPVMSPPSNIANLETRQLPTRSTANAKHGGLIMPRSKPRIPPRHYQLTQATHTQHSAEPRGRTQAPPTSPSSKCQAKSQAQSTKVSGQVSTTKAESESVKTMAGSKSITTPITTPITIVPTLPEDILVSSSWREVPSPSARRSGKGLNMASPPQMPGRAEGTHNVPQVSPQRDASGHHQSRATGTGDGEISSISTSLEGSPDRDLIPRALRPSTGNRAPLGKPTDTALEGSIEGSWRKESCLHYKGCSSAVKPHNMHGFIHMQGKLQQENTDPKMGRSCICGVSQANLEDHQDCCPECCAVGCHASCLGHSSPSGGTANVFRVADSFGAGKKGVRNSMRLSRRTRVRRSAGGSQETETEEVAELETPTAWDAQGPASLGIPYASASIGSYGVCSNTNEFLAHGGAAALLENAGVRFAVLRLWLTKHPRLPRLVQAIMVKLLDMSKHVTETVCKMYRVVVVYSETGNLDPGRQTSLVGFAGDCAKAVLYSLILTAVGVMFGRIVLIITGLIRWLVWFLRLVVWIVGAAGLGLLW